MLYRKYYIDYLVGNSQYYIYKLHKYTKTAVAGTMVISDSPVFEISTKKRKNLKHRA